MTLDELRDIWIPLRLHYIDIMADAWELIGEAEVDNDNRRVSILVDGKTWKGGNVSFIANPFIDAGIMYARALLQFLGMRTKDGRLIPVSRREPGDFGIEQFSAYGRSLAMVDPQDAIRAYEGPQDEAEESLVAVFELANKLVAHFTTGSLSKVWNTRHIDIACAGIPILFHSHFFSKLESNEAKWADGNSD